MSVNEIRQTDSELQAAINEANLEWQRAESPAERKVAWNKMQMLAKQCDPSRGRHVDVRC